MLRKGNNDSFLEEVLASSRFCFRKNTRDRDGNQLFRTGHRRHSQNPASLLVTQAEISRISIALGADYQRNIQPHLLLKVLPRLRAKLASIILVSCKGQVQSQWPMAETVQSKITSNYNLGLIHAVSSRFWTGAYHLA